MQWLNIWLFISCPFPDKKEYECQGDPERVPRTHLVVITHDVPRGAGLVGHTASGGQESGVCACVLGHLGAGWTLTNLDKTRDKTTQTNF